VLNVPSSSTLKERFGLRLACSHAFSTSSWTNPVVEPGFEEAPEELPTPVRLKSEPPKSTLPALAEIARVTPMLTASRSRTSRMLRFLLQVADGTENPHHLFTRHYPVRMGVPLQDSHGSQLPRCVARTGEHPVQQSSLEPLRLHDQVADFAESCRLGRRGRLWKQLLV